MFSKTIVTVPLENKTIGNPVLIFCEHHADPILGKVLLKLIPKLKQLHYQIFLDENTDTLEQEIANREVWVKLYKEFKFQFLSHGRNIKDENDRKFFWEKNLFDNNRLKKANLLKNEYPVNHVIEAMESYCIPRHTAQKSYLQFLNMLNSHAIKYKGIDYAGRFENTDSPKREKSMASSYLSHRESAFGMIGFAHASPLQYELLKHIPLEEAFARFKFFCLTSLQNTLDEIKTFPHDSHFTKDLPLGMIYAHNQSVDEMVGLVLDTIKYCNPVHEITNTVILK